MENIKTFIKHNWVTLGLAVGTLGLVVATVMIALKLKELGTQPVTPGVPASQPAAQGEECISTSGGCAFAFSVPTPTPTVTGTPSPSPTPTPKIECGEKICQSDADCSGLEYKVCADIGSDNTNQKKCVLNAEWFDGCTPPGPTNTPTPEPTATVTPTPKTGLTATPTPVTMPAAGNTLTTVGFSAGAIILGVLGLLLLF